MKITELRQKKADALAKARAIHDLAASQNRLTTPAEDTDFDAAMAEAKGYDPHIARAEALMEAERFAPTVSAAATGAPRAIVGHNNAEDRPFAGFGENIFAIRTAAIARQTGSAVDPRLYGALGGNEAVDAEGGWLIRPEYSDDILQRTYDEGQVTGRCMRVPMSSNRLIMNGLDEDSRATGSRYGGIQVYRLAEAGTYTGSKPKFKQIQLTANKMIGLLYVTDEVEDDAPALGKWASTNFPKAMAFTQDDEAYNGTGAGQMLGVIPSGAAVVVAKDTSQATGTISTTNFTNMKARLWGPSRRNAVIFINADLEAQLYSLTIPGATGTATALYVQGQNKDGYGTILSLPVIPIEQAAAGGTLGDVLMADMSQYIIGERQGIQTAASIHVAFLTGEQAFRWTLRNDGQPIPKKPLTPYKGNNTLSPFVTLAARP
jgi:HK97 family phage major capsid protein